MVLREREVKILEKMDYEVYGRPLRVVVAAVNINYCNVDFKYLVAAKKYLPEVEKHLLVGEKYFGCS